MIGDLRAANTNYDQNIAFVYVDWDAHARSPVSQNLRISRQSTLVMLNQQGEVGRVVAQTSQGIIKQLLDKAPPRAKNAASCS
ncbi:MAG: hypothetical protein HOE62_00265 [Alphaproteobacteria bacterium]|nr:hypothetical protein [Alphaproteobacteria bacterium]MBT4016351.1 hypothetical protein [Alphaproteobacteria bacterium]MBT4964829.1 hypothetical protein [Alphaproteobacteria bacterium]MBT5161694.1 hypothetical protein [Alphaproteobacteria bacterium]MBT5917119.1 hypothetical protein [Alphaproteobacteria bacterium]